MRRKKEESELNQKRIIEEREAGREIVKADGAKMRKADATAKNKVNKGLKRKAISVDELEKVSSCNSKINSLYLRIQIYVFAQPIFVFTYPYLLITIKYFYLLISLFMTWYYAGE